MEIVSTVLRLLLLLGHLAAFAVAFSAILREDYNLVARRKIDIPGLRETSRLVFWSLMALTVTGVAIIGIDTGFDLAVIASKPKLLAKLSVVGILSLNGAVLHFVAFPALRSSKNLRFDSAFLSAFGAVSTVSWSFAAFIGIAKPLASMLGYSGFMELYLALLLGGVAFSLVAIRPQIASMKAADGGGVWSAPLNRLASRMRRSANPDPATSLLGRL